MAQTKALLPVVTNSRDDTRIFEKAKNLEEYKKPSWPILLFMFGMI